MVSASAATIPESSVHSGNTVVDTITPETTSSSSLHRDAKEVKQVASFGGMRAGGSSQTSALTPNRLAISLLAAGKTRVHVACPPTRRGERGRFLHEGPAHRPFPLWSLDSWT